MSLLIISIFLCVSAVSAANSTQYYVDSSVDVSGDGSQDSPFKTIEEAVNVVDENKTTEIYVNGTYTFKNQLNLNYNHNNTNLSFIGINNPTLTVSVNNLFKVSGNSNIIFSNVTFSSSSKQILSQSGGKVTFDGCTFSNLFAPSDNKGVFSGENSYLCIVNSKFILKNNYPVIVLKNYQNVSISNSQFSGGGRVVYSNINSPKKGGNITISNSSFSNCLYPVRLTSNILNVTDSTFTNCNGNAIFHSTTNEQFKKYTEIYIDNSKFISTTYEPGYKATDFNNFVSPTEGGDHYGGAIYSQAKVLNITNSLVKGNVMSQGGGTFYVVFKGAGIYASNINCINTTFDNNQVLGGTMGEGFSKDGAGIYATGNAYIFNSTFINNVVNKKDGGAIYAESNLNVENCLFSNNKQPSGYSSITFLGNSKINNNMFLDLGASVANKTDVYDLDYNWWNTNERPNLLVNNWIILDVESELDELVNGSDVLFTLQFKNIQYANGTIAEYNNSMTDRLLKAEFNEGTIKESGNLSYEVQSLNTTFTYTPEGDIGDVVTLTVYSDNSFILSKEYSIVESFLSIQADDIFVGDNAIIYVAITSPIVNGTVSLEIDGNAYTNKSKNNKAVFNISGLKYGVHDITAKYGVLEATSCINVSKLNTTAIFNVNGNVEAGKDIELVITLASDASGFIDINVNGAEDKIAVNYGIARYDMNSLSPIVYNINISYSGDGKYNSVNNSTALHVIKSHVSLNVNAKGVYVGEDLIVNVEFNESDVDGNVTIKLDGIEKGTVDVSNGTASLTIKNLDAGKYAISATYNGGFKYAAGEANGNAEVYKQNSTFDIGISQNSDNTIRLIVDINATGNVTFSVGNVEKTVKIENNRAILDNIKLNNANYIAEITYNGDKNYYPFTSEFNFAISNGKLLIRYYVDGIVKKSGDGSRTNPFKTINEAVNHVVDNYTIEIYILPDEYSISPKITIDLNHKSKGTSLSFVGWGGDMPIINSADGYDAVNTFRIGPNSDVSFKNLWIVKPGDRFFNVENGNLTITGCVLDNAKNDVFKSTIYMSGGNLILDSTTVRDCDYSGSSNGGFIHLATKSANVLINNSKFSYNMGTEASVIYAQGTGQDVAVNVTILNSLFKGNTNALKVASMTTIDNCTFENNLGKYVVFSSKINNYGDNNTLYISNSKFTGNTAAHPVESAGDLLVIKNSTFNNNNGNGLVYAHKSASQDQNQFIATPKVYVHDSLFEHNNVGNGAIYSYVGLENVSSSRFVLNSGLKGAAIFAYDNVNVYNSTFENNNITSEMDGAAIYIERGNEVNINYSSFRNNKALDVNNAITIMSVSGKTTINNNAFRDNDGFDVYNKGISEINADANWWGSNDNPNLNINVSNWVIFTATSTPNYDNTTLNANFNNLKTIDNETISYNSSIPDREVRFASDDGEFVDGYYGGFVFNGVDGNAVFVPDENNFTIDVHVDDKYITTLTGTLKVKLTPEILIDVNDTPVGSSVIIVITVADATGNVTVSVANYSDTIDLNNSGACLIIPDLSVGDYHVDVVYNGDYDYFATSETADFSVLKVNTIMNLTFDGERLIIELLNDTMGNLNIDAGVRNYSSKIKNGKAIVDITSLGNGNYTLLVSYSGDDKYNPVNDSIDVEIKLNTTKVTPEILIDVNDTYVGSPVSVVIIVVNATGNVTVFVGDYEETVDLNNSIAYLNISDLHVNDYQLKVLYNGDDNYLVNDKTVNFSVLKLNATMEITYDDEKVCVKLPSDASGVVNITANNVTLSSDVIDGEANVDISSLNSGNYTLIVYYGGDDNYNPMTDSIDIEIAPKIILKAYDLVKYYGNSARFKVTLNDSNGNPLGNRELTVNINGVNYTRFTDAEGIMTMAINLGSGNYSVIVTYDDNITPITSNATIEILSTISGNDITKMFKNQTQYYAKFVDTNGNSLPKGSEVTFNINGVMYKRLVEDDTGRAKLSINLMNGTYILTAINPDTNEMISNTIRVLSNFVENKNITMYFHNGTGYVVRVIGSDGKVVGAGENVTFNINGVFYTRQTNSDGYARLNINLNQGDYIITAWYNDCAVSNTIKVLPILTAKDLTKKYSVSDSFKVNVVDGHGRALSGVTVSFNINGVFYDRVSNSDGVASLNINLMPGKYIITSTYNQCYISNFVTVLE